MARTKPKIPIAYIDEMSEVDKRFRALTELCQGCCDPERVQPFLLEQVGYLFQDLLERKLVIEHFFFGLDLDGEAVTEARAEAEIHYLSARHPGGNDRE